MPKDKYKAIWVSHSSIRDFLNCPRAYYLRNVYKNPKTGRKISITKPPLALGHVVHSVMDDISWLPVEKRFTIPLQERFQKAWEKVKGERGGFRNEKEEKEFKDRGLKMIKRVEKSKGPLTKKAIKIKEDLPYFWLSVEDNIILCGKIDWLEYEEKTDSIHIIDFKTGRIDEKEDSLQLPIYFLLVTECQDRPISKVSYWYLNGSNKPKSIPLPDEKEAKERVIEVAQRIKLARKLEHFKCPKDEKKGCVFCAPFEAVLQGRGKFVGLGGFKEEIYYLTDKETSLSI